MTSAVLLPEALAVAVPLNIRILAARGGPDEFDVERCRAHSFSAGGALVNLDEMMFGGRPGKAGEAFNALADCLAMLSFCPGGVTAFDMTWCAAHIPNGKRKGESNYCEVCE